MSVNIAFVGKAGAGKTTIADNLVENNDYIKRSFAAPLKKIAEQILLRPLDKTNPDDRKFLQILGTDLSRARDKEIWIKHMKNSLQGLKCHDATCKSYEYCTSLPSRPFVIDDCRFENEAEYLKSEKFLIIRITGRQSKLSAENASHLSEAGQDQIKCDFELDNSGTIEETMNALYQELEIYLWKTQ
jgi:hypothetical protein